MRIVYASWEYPPDFGGGIGTFVHAIARILASRGHHITVITFTRSPYPVREQRDGVAIVRLPVAAGVGPEPVATLRCWQSRADALAAFLQRAADAGQADLIEFGDYRGEGVTFLTGADPRTRPVSVLRLHTPLSVLNRYNASRVRHPVLEEFENQAILRADRLVSPSEALAREMRELLPGLGEIELSPYPADPEFLALGLAEIEELGDEIVYVGRLEERKGVQTLIQAAPTLLDACPQARLILIGGDTAVGPSHPSMRALLLSALPRRCHDRVSMPGPIPREQLIERYRRARFCVFPSLFENFPNTCLEAMSLGRCVIGTDNSGMAEMIEDGVSGVIARAGDSAQLADAMVRLYRMPEPDRRRMGCAARQRVLDRYHPDVIAPRIEEQYERYIGEWRGRSAPRRPSAVRSEPRVTVVIPCFNHGAFLPDAVESVRAQTYPHTDCVVVDDGSTDPGTKLALDRLRQQGVRVISQENQGLASARNAGVRATDAEFFAPLDADDRIEPTFVEQLLGPMLDDPPLGYCYSFAKFFGAVDGVWQCPAYDPTRLPVENLSTATAVVRREAYELVGGYSQDMIYGFEDWDFWLALLSVGYHGRLVPEPLFLYRKHASGSMLTKTQHHRPEMIRRMIEHHRDLFATMFDASLVRKDAMFFEAHMRAAGVFVPGPGGPGTATTQDDELYQELHARAELDFIENSRFWRGVRRIRELAPCRLMAYLMRGSGWRKHLDVADPRERLRRIKASRAYRAIQLIKRSPMYKVWARYKYGPGGA